MQPLRVTTLRAMRMIERWDTPHRVQFCVVHSCDFESSNDEGSLSEITATTEPTTTIVPTTTTSPPPLIVALTPAITPALEECLAHLKQGQFRIEGLL